MLKKPTSKRFSRETLEKLQNENSSTPASRLNRLLYSDPINIDDLRRELGGDLNTPINSFGSTIAHRAITDLPLEACKLLHEAGLDFGKGNECGVTPTYIACGSSYLKDNRSVQLGLEEKVDWLISIGKVQLATNSKPCLGTLNEKLRRKVHEASSLQTAP